MFVTGDHHAISRLPRHVETNMFETVSSGLGYGSMLSPYIYIYVYIYMYMYNFMYVYMYMYIYVLEKKCDIHCIDNY